MKTQVYEKIAKLIVGNNDAGGELVKLLQAIDETLIGYRKVGILITQSVPEDGGVNPIVHISVFTNRQTDFPADTQEKFDQWIIDYAEELKSNNGTLKEE